MSTAMHESGATWSKVNQSFQRSDNHMLFPGSQRATMKDINATLGRTNVVKSLTASRFLDTGGRSVFVLNWESLYFVLICFFQK